MYGQINLDSIRLVISEKEELYTTSPITKKMELAKELAFLYFYTDIDEKGFVNWAEQYFNLCVENEDYNAERIGYFNYLSNYSFYDEELYQVRLKRAKELVKTKADSVLNLAVIISESQYAAFIEGDFKSSLGQLEKAELLNNALGRNYKTPFLYSTFAVVYEYSGKPLKAIMYADKMLQLDDLNQIEKARAHHAMGTALFEARQLDSVAYYLNAAISYYTELSNTYNIITLYNKLGEYYLIKAEPQKALEYFLKIGPIIQQAEFNFGTPLYDIYYNIGEFYHSQSKLDSARLYYEKSIAQAYFESDNDPLIKYRSNQSFEALGRLDEQSHNYKNALENFIVYKSYSDTLSKYTRNKTIEELSIKYETREKEQQIALLDSENKFLAIKNQNYLISLGGALVAAILIFGFYLNIRQKNQQIQKQKEALRDALTTKDQLFAIIGHDLRKPALAFRGISKKVNYLIQQEDFETLNKFGVSLEKSAFSLNSLLDNLLNWALQQRNVFPHNPVPIDIKKVTQSEYQMFSQIANEKGVELKFDIEDATNVFSDPNAFVTIVRNLIDNAIKYTCLLYTSPSPRDQRGSRMPSSA